jgi:hypothetical protein
MSDKGPEAPQARPLSETLFEQEDDDRSLTGSIARLTRGGGKAKAAGGTSTRLTAAEKARNELLAKLVMLQMEQYGKRRPGFTFRAGEKLAVRIEKLLADTNVDWPKVLHLAAERLLDDLGY